jgi:hypothetical protein
MSQGGAEDGPTDPWGNPVYQPLSPPYRPTPSGEPPRDAEPPPGADASEQPPASDWWGTSGPATASQGGGVAGASSGGRGLAISGMVAGVVGFLALGLLLGPLAIVLGVLARRRLRSADEPGTGLATAAIVLGVIVFVLNVVAIIYFITNPDAFDQFDGTTG